MESKRLLATGWLGLAICFWASTRAHAFELMARDTLILGNQAQIKLFEYHGDIMVQAQPYHHVSPIQNPETFAKVLPSGSSSGNDFSATTMGIFTLPPGVFRLNGEYFSFVRNVWPFDSLQPNDTGIFLAEFKDGSDFRIVSEIDSVLNGVAYYPLDSTYIRYQPGDSGNVTFGMFNGKGENLWTKRIPTGIGVPLMFGGYAIREFTPRYIRQIRTKEYYLAGTHWGSTAALLKLDSTGGLIFNKTFGIESENGPRTSMLHCLETAENGDVIAIGSRDDTKSLIGVRISHEHDTSTVKIIPFRNPVSARYHPLRGGFLVSSTFYLGAEFLQFDGNFEITGVDTLKTGKENVNDRSELVKGDTLYVLTVLPLSGATYELEIWAHPLNKPTVAAKRGLDKPRALTRVYFRDILGRAIFRLDTGRPRRSAPVELITF